MRVTLAMETLNGRDMLEVALFSFCATVLIPTEGENFFRTGPHCRLRPPPGATTALFISDPSYCRKRHLHLLPPLSLKRRKVTHPFLQHVLFLLTVTLAILTILQLEIRNQAPPTFPVDVAAPVKYFEHSTHICDGAVPDVLADPRTIVDLQHHSDAR